MTTMSQPAASSLALTDDDMALQRMMADVHLDTDTNTEAIPWFLAGRLCAATAYTQSFRVRRASFGGIQEKLDELDHPRKRVRYVYPIQFDLIIFAFPRN